MSVGTVSYAAPLATAGIPGARAAAPQAAITAPAASVQAQSVGSPNAAVATSFQPANNGVIGGGLTQDVGNAVSRLASFAQGKMDDVQRRMQGEMASTGAIDPGKLQSYNMEMSKYEMIMQMAAKIQEKEERAASVWLRP